MPRPRGHRRSVDVKVCVQERHSGSCAQKVELFHATFFSYRQFDAIWVESAHGTLIRQLQMLIGYQTELVVLHD